MGRWHMYIYILTLTLKPHKFSSNPWPRIQMGNGRTEEWLPRRCLHLRNSPHSVERTRAHSSTHEPARVHSSVLEPARVHLEYLSPLEHTSWGTVKHNWRLALGSRATLAAMAIFIYIYIYGYIYICHETGTNRERGRISGYGKTCVFIRFVLLAALDYLPHRHSWQVWWYQDARCISDM